MTDPIAPPGAVPAPVPLVQPSDRLTRAFELYRRTTASRSAMALLLANAIPLVGVLFFGWSLWTILVLYWVENGIVGFWTVPRILLARGSVIADLAAKARLGTSSDAELASAMQQLAPVSALDAVLRIPMAAFFLVHYGLFWFVHGVFVFALPSFGAFQGPAYGDGLVDPQTGVAFLPGAGGATAAQGAFGEILWSSVILGAIALFISHGASFVLNYLGKREYLTTSPARAMGSPYGRVVVLHLTILLGAFAIAGLGAPIALLVVLVIGKTVLDVGLHLRQQARPTA